MAAPLTAPLQLAAVDLGSNSFRLEIGRVDGNRIERQGYWKETVRLAAGLDASDRLSKKAIETACECLARMNERLRGFAPEQVRAVGTQTLRVARNVNDFLLEAQSALGYPIEIIAGREEARLVFEGCMHTLPPSDRRRLVVDIGGASTELIVGRGFAAEAAESFKLGCVSVSVRFFEDGVIDRSRLKRAQVACSAEIEEATSAFSRAHWDDAFGSSGTVGAVADIFRAEGWSDGTITAEGLLKLRQALIAAGEIKRIRLASLKADRQEVIAGGTAILAAVFETLGITEMRPANGASVAAESSVTITGSPHAKASMMVIGAHSYHVEGNTSTRASRISVMTRSRGWLPSRVTPSGHSMLLSGPSPATKRGMSFRVRHVSARVSMPFSFARRPTNRAYPPPPSPTPGSGGSRGPAGPWFARFRPRFADKVTVCSTT